MKFAIRWTKHAVAALALLAAAAASVSAEPLDWRGLNLLNNWERFSTDTRTPAVAMDSNDIVHLRGAVSQAGDFEPIPFVLPKRFRPQDIVYVPVDLFDTVAGRLIIEPNGIVTVQSSAAHAAAQQFTSLEGVRYSRR